MKKFVLVLSVTFIAVLTAVVGFRLSPDAMAVIIGIICGMLASVPTSVILVWVLRQRDRQAEAEINTSRFGHYPPVVVVNGQHPQGYPTPAPLPALLPTTPPGMRDFKVIGQENTESVGDFLPSIWE
jgi:hypothetical protein